MLAISILVAVAVYLAFPLRKFSVMRTNGFAPRRKRLTDKQQLDLIMAFRIELESGATPHVALSQALNCIPENELRHTRESLRDELNPVIGLRHDAAQYPILGHLSVAMTISRTQGSQLSSSLDVMTKSIQESIAMHQSLRSELASVRATIYVLAALPVMGLMFGTVLNAQPLAWLSGTGFGRLCLVLATIFELTGFWWTHVLVKRALATQS